MGVWYEEYAEFSFVFIEVESPVEHSKKLFHMEAFRQVSAYSLSFISYSAQQIAFGFQ